MPPVVQQPKPGAIFYCFFGEENRSEYRPPEIYKTRPVVVVSNRRFNRIMATVIALSTTEPRSETEKKRTYFIPGGKYGSLPNDGWVKAQVLESVSLNRLSFARNIAIEALDSEDMEGIREIINISLSLV